MPHLFYDTFGYPFYNTFFWAFLVAIPWWGWLGAGIAFGLFVASVIISMRDAVMRRAITYRLSQLSGPGAVIEVGPTVLDWVAALTQAFMDKLDAVRAESYQRHRNQFQDQVTLLENRVASLIDERSKLRGQLDKSHKRPRDAKGHFLKASNRA